MGNNNFLKSEIMLQLTVSRPACLGVGYSSWPHEQIFVTVRQLRIYWRESPSLTRGLVWSLYFPLGLGRFFSGSSPAGLMTVFTVSKSRLSQPGGQCSYLYLPRTGLPSYTPGTGFLFLLFLRLAGLRCRYLTRLQTGWNTILNSYLQLQLQLIYDRQSVGQSVLVSGAHLEPVTNFSFS
jgi:hypothetical protein